MLIHSSYHTWCTIYSDNLRINFYIFDFNRCINPSFFTEQFCKSFTCLIVHRITDDILLIAQKDILDVTWNGDGEIA